MSRWNTILVAGLALLSSGCGKEIVAGGQKPVDAKAVGDGSPASGMQSEGVYHAVVPIAPSGSAFAGAAAQPQGTIAFDARVSLVTEGGAVVPLNRDAATGTVRIEATDTAVVADTRVEAVTYTRARVTFTRVNANVSGGLVIGGISVTGQVRVGIAPGDSVVVEAPIRMTGSARQTLVIDLDASEWLRQSVGGVVSASAFRGAVDLRVK